MQDKTVRSERWFCFFVLRQSFQGHSENHIKIMRKKPEEYWPEE